MCIDVCISSRRRVDLNNTTARVSQPCAREDGRIAVQLMSSWDKVWLKPTNLMVIPSISALGEPPFDAISDAEKTDMTMYLLSLEKSTAVPGCPMSVVDLR